MKTDVICELRDLITTRAKVLADGRRVVSRAESRTCLRSKDRGKCGEMIIQLAQAPPFTGAEVGRGKGSPDAKRAYPRG